MVQLRYARRPTHASIDYAAAFDDAVASGDSATEAALEELLFDFVLEQLVAMPPAEFEAYLRSRAVWRSHDGWTVYRSTGSPCVVFTGYRDADGDVGVLLLGFFAGTAGTLAAWWNDVVVPRLEAET